MFSINKKIIQRISNVFSAFSTQGYCHSYPIEMQKITPQLINEFKTFPNQPVIWSLINGSNKGKIHIPSDESAILVENAPNPFVFIAGALSDQILDTVATLFPRDSMVYCNPSYHHWFLRRGWEINLRVQLLYSNPHVKKIKDGFFITPINDMEIFKKCFWFEEVAGYYGSPEMFLKNGKGYALSNGSQIISEAYINYRGDNYAELGVVTHPLYRKLGAGAQVASYLVEDCISHDITPIWSCNTVNLPSLKTALDIGFRIERYYVQMVLDAERDNSDSDIVNDKVFPDTAEVPNCRLENNSLEPSSIFLGSSDPMLEHIS